MYIGIDIGLDMNIVIYIGMDTDLDMDIGII